MATGARLSIIDFRQSSRHPVSHRTIATHRRLGEFAIHLANISAHGFMTACEASGGEVSSSPTTPGPITLGPGERVTLRLPHIGLIEAHLIWSSGARAGFQFERIIACEDFVTMLGLMRADSKPR